VICMAVDDELAGEVGGSVGFDGLHAVRGGDVGVALFLGVVD